MSDPARLIAMAQSLELHAAELRSLAAALAPACDPDRSEPLGDTAALSLLSASHEARADRSRPLVEALAYAEQALASLSEGAHVELRAGMQAHVAGLLYELGDDESLDRALSLYTEASRALSDAGEPVEAARLLNEQAEVWIRLGDGVRAAHLLRESREVFAAQAVVDPYAAVELAQTEHALARLPLHVPAREGAGIEHWERAVEHGKRAGELYQDLDMPEAFARTEETVGRLRVRLGDTVSAAEHLQTAATLQQQLGDGIGLARTAGALSELAAERDELAAALELLATSVQLNRQKGSPIGLRYNREALAAVAPSLSGHGELVPMFEAVAQALEHAIATVGSTERRSVRTHTRSV